MMERRRYPRYNCLLAVKYKFSKRDENHSYCFSKNLSRGGICLPLTRYIAPSKKLIIEIEIPDTKRKFIAQSKVVWCKKNEQPWQALYDAGLELKNVEPEILGELVNFANAHQWQKTDLEKDLEGNGFPLIE